MVGSGQSAAEVLLDLHSRLSVEGGQDARKYEVELIFRAGSFKPSDDTPFSNEIFDPSSKDMHFLGCLHVLNGFVAADFMFQLPPSARHEVLKEYHHTNYSVVNPRTIDTVSMTS